MRYVANVVSERMTGGSGRRGGGTAMTSCALLALLIAGSAAAGGHVNGDGLEAGEPERETEAVEADAEGLDDDAIDEAALVPLVTDEAMPEEQFDLQVRGLEEQVTDLKEKIFQTKARLLLLQETVIGGDLSTGARAVIVHRNEMGASFVLESVTYILDGAPIFTRVDPDGDLDRQKEIEVFNGRIVPGTHQIGVRLVYRGSGYGIFSYLNDYRFRVQSSYSFNAEGGRVTTVRVVGYERGGFTAELQDRPGVRYEEEVTRELPGTGTHTVQLEGEDER